MGHLDRNKCISADTLISDAHQSSQEILLNTINKIFRNLFKIQKNKGGTTKSFVP